MQSVLPRIELVFISADDNYYTTGRYSSHDTECVLYTGVCFAFK